MRSVTRSNAAGILLSTVALDSDHHVVSVTHSCLLTIENEHPHTLQLQFFKDVYDEAYDRPERREISDEDKGLEAAWGKIMTNGNTAFNCVRHRGENVSTTVNNGLVDRGCKTTLGESSEGIVTC
ncbi:hypothetical protein CYMTET_27167 [Cymbomonas tetramitiformis]|uniref:Uncharacterized protein n=1 Tax=Cymbomonas tetramitiformis TaxID=36881 RepID=A0AAE0FQL7_9CHLO|nr:hypothetical protein CYMTET_27167 [Cymbomonas tetramitiformis]